MLSFSRVSRNCGTERRYGHIARVAKAGAICLVSMAPLFGTGLFTAAHAQILCTEPLQPECVRPESNFESEAIQRRCISDAEAYIVKIDEYVECNKQKIAEMLAQKETVEKRIKELEENAK